MSLLSPASIAIIGASAEEHKVGHYVLKNLISQGFAGAIYPVNPKGGEILSKKAYESVTAIPGSVDLAVIVTPGKTVKALADECGAKGVKTLVVISAGFGELGTPEGHALEAELVATAKAHGMTLIGPNCLGVLRPALGVNVSFANNLKQPGSIALLSQSGALAVALMDEAPDLGIDFSLVISMGNKAATDECDLLELCEKDPETKVIGMYLESIKDGKRFLSVASRVSATKPIVLIKSGTSDSGRKAVSSHTGALAGSDAAIDAACTQAGIIRAHDTEEFLDALRTLATLPALNTDRIAVITNAGGPGILATDASERERLGLATLEVKTHDNLKTKLPPAASVGNPIDVLGDALADRYAEAIAGAAADPNVEGIAVLLTPQVMTPCEDVAKAVIAARKKVPLLPIVTAFMGDGSVESSRILLHQNHIPCFPSPERAIRALRFLRQRGKLMAAAGRKPAPIGKDLSSSDPKSTSKGTTTLSTLGAGFLPAGGGLLDEQKTIELLTAYGLPVPAGSVATTEDEAAAIATTIGFPLVAKISSPQILHKSDIGGVRINLKTIEEVKTAFREIIANAKKAEPKAEIRGVLLQPLLPAGHEYIVGVVADPSFGHLIMAGLGGIYTELLRDTVFRVAPIGTEDAYGMLENLRSWKLLLGMRGKAQSDIDALATLIGNVSRLVTDVPEIAELDLNPVIVRSDGVVIADAKIVLK